MPRHAIFTKAAPSGEITDDRTQKHGKPWFLIGGRNRLWRAGRPKNPAILRDGPKKQQQGASRGALDANGHIGETWRIMTVAKILKDVGQLPASERREVAALLVAKYPPRSVEQLVSRAEKEARQDKWVPMPPTADNIPTGEALAQALRRAKKLEIA